MSKKIVFFIITLVVFSFIHTSLEAQQRRPQLLQMPNVRFGLHLAEQNLFEANILLRMKNDIGLTEEQEKKLEEMMLVYEETAIRRQAELKILETRFAALLKNQKVNRKEMEKMARDIGNMKTDHQIAHLNYLLDIRDMLSPEQIQKIEDFRSKMRRSIMQRGQGNPPMPRRK